MQGRHRERDGEAQGFRHERGALARAGAGLCEQLSVSALLGWREENAFSTNSAVWYEWCLSDWF